MKIFHIAFILICSTSVFAQFDYTKNWEYSADDNGKVGIHHTGSDNDYFASFSFEYNGHVYSKDLNVKGKEWGFVNLREDFSFSTKNLKTNPGMIEIELDISVNDNAVFKKKVWFSPNSNNELHEIDLTGVEDLLHLYGDHIEDSYFWSDKKGNHFVIRSRNGDKAGLFLSYWTINHKGEAEQIDYYKNQLDCGPKLNRVQQHYEEVALNDADSDGVYEFYTMALDACLQSETESKAVILFVFTAGQKSLKLEGGTYATSSEHTNQGGQYVISPKLKNLKKIEEKAKDVWEIFILNI